MVRKGAEKRKPCCANTPAPVNGLIQVQLTKQRCALRGFVSWDRSGSSKDEIINKKIPLACGGQEECPVQVRCPKGWDRLQVESEEFRALWKDGDSLRLLTRWDRQLTWNDSQRAEYSRARVSEVLKRPRDRAGVKVGLKLLWGQDQSDVTSVALLATETIACFLFGRNEPDVSEEGVVKVMIYYQETKKSCCLLTGREATIAQKQVLIYAKGGGE